MSLSLSDVRDRLTLSESFKPVENRQDQCIFSLDGKKFYLITKISENGFCVERRYRASSRFDCFKTNAARILGRSHRQVIRRFAILHAKTLPQDHPLARLKVLVPAAESSTIDSSVRSSERDSLLTGASSGGYGATGGVERAEKTVPGTFTASRRHSVSVCSDMITHTDKPTLCYLDSAGRQQQVRAPECVVSEEEQGTLSGIDNQLIESVSGLKRTPLLTAAIAGAYAATSGVDSAEETDYDPLTESGRHRVSVCSQVITYTGQLARLYVDPMGERQAVREPRFGVSREQQKTLSGMGKKLVAWDDEFVMLEASKSIDKTKKLEFDAIARALKPYPTCCPNIVVEERFIGATYGGEDLFVCAKSNLDHCVALQAFKGAVSDLKAMHEKRIYLRDIKPENLTLHKSGHVMFIDTDSAAIPELRNYEDGTYTEQYSIKGLVDSCQAGNQCALKTADNYAMLLSMIETTSSEPALKGLTNQYGKLPKTTFVRFFNKNLLRTWIRKNITLEHRTSVFEFLRDPAKNTLNCALYDIFNW